MSLTPLTFTGVSTYSRDFQTILNRATQIASLPIQQLQNQQKDLLHRSSTSPMCRSLCHFPYRRGANYLARRRADERAEYHTL